MAWCSNWKSHWQKTLNIPPGRLKFRQCMEQVLRTQQWCNFLATRAFRARTTTRDHLLSSRSTSHLLSNYQTSSLMQPPLSMSIQSPPPVSIQSLCPVVTPVQPHSVNSTTLPGLVVSQIQPNLPAITSAAQSHPPVLGQVQTPPSLPSPFQQLITKEQTNFALSASNQGLFTNGSFSNCTFNLKTKHPRVIYSDSEEDWLLSVLLYGLLSSTYSYILTSVQENHGYKRFTCSNIDSSPVISPLHERKAASVYYRLSDSFPVQPWGLLSITWLAEPDTDFSRDL